VLYSCICVFCVILGGVRLVKPSPAGIHSDVTAQESTDWLEMMFKIVVRFFAPDDEEEGIHQLTETLTCKKTSPHTD